MQPGTPAVKVFSNTKIPERTDAIYRCQFTAADVAETLLVPVSIISIEATLATATNEIVNGRNRQDVFNANGGSLDANGWFTLLLTGADHQVTQAIDGLEWRVLTIHVSYVRIGIATDGELHREIRYAVRDLQRVPTDLMVTMSENVPIQSL